MGTIPVRMAPTTEQLPQLSARWAKLLRTTGLDQRMGMSVLTTLIACYDEPHRHYHNLSHLQGVLGWVETLLAAGAPVRRPDHVRLAAWFHDIVYDPMATDNEERSAAYTEALLALCGAVSPTRRHVGDLVRMTAAHEPGDDLDAVVLADADLAILAADPPTYGAYVEAIRAEYAHVEQAVFDEGRATFLRGMLAREHLFGTAVLQTQEQQARANMTAELRELEKAGSGGPDARAGGDGQQRSQG